MPGKGPSGLPCNQAKAGSERPAGREFSAAEARPRQRAAQGRLSPWPRHHETRHGAASFPLLGPIIRRNLSRTASGKDDSVDARTGNVLFSRVAIPSPAGEGIF